ncbi:MAG: membrane protein insertase YidC, partial [Chloroflexota bacterium]
MTTSKERTPPSTPAGAPEISASMSKDMLKFLGILVVIGLIVWQWAFFVSIFGNILLWIYSLIASIPGAFGWAIILFTVLIRVVTWPLNAQQMKSMKAMQEMQSSKEWKAIQKKYEKEPEKKNVELMRLQNERGISPFGGCLPL